MIEIKAKKIEVVRRFDDLSLILYVDGEIEEEQLDELSISSKPWRVALKRWRKSRSLDANAYCWSLLSKAAAATNEPVSDYYRRIIKELGGISKTICIEAKDVREVVSWWTSRGLGWQVDILPSKIKGCRNLVLYPGSSIFDTEQMARFIDLVQQDCVAVGVPVDLERDVETMLNEWGDTNNKKFVE